MWNNLRARHYSVIILLAIVALETSAIAIDKFINRESEVAFTIESPFQNNPFIQNFKIAEASCTAIPVKINRSKLTTPVATAKIRTLNSGNDVLESTSRSVSAEFIAAASKNDDASNYVEYAVQPGDSLSNIAMMFGSGADAIKKANRLEDKHNIRAGQTIKVPMPNSEMLYTVKSGDSLSKIASRFKIPLKNLIEENNLKSHMLMADQRLKIPFNGKPEVQILKSDTTMAEMGRKLEMVREPKSAVVTEPKLQMIKLERVQTAQAPASKPTLEFLKKDLISTPPALNQSVAVKPAVVEVPESKVSADEKGNREINYTVEKGDNLMKIALRYNTTVAQLQDTNNLKNTRLQIGQKLVVNPDQKLYRVVKTEDTTATGGETTVAAKPRTEEKKTAAVETANIVEHKVKAGESLSLIARKYNTNISAIIAANDLSSTVVQTQQVLKVPADTTRDFKVVQGASKVTRVSMRMPVRGRLSDKYGWRNHPVYRKRLFHAGIDIAAPKGAPVTAAMNGKVIYAGRRAGYGKLVILSHANGYSSRYAHCSSILVKKGQTVKAGQLISRVGATGVATGNHLHFEVRKNGKTQNPLSYLK